MIIKFTPTEEEKTRVIYGDTDSVFVKFETDTSWMYRKAVKEDKSDKEIKELKDKCMAESFKLGDIASKEITNSLFKKPILLEYEKTYSPLILMGKKMYIGALHESSTTEWDYIDKKGVALKRRDNCHYMKDTYQHVVDLVMKKGVKGVEESYVYLEERIDKLLYNEADFKDLIITKKLNSSYKNENNTTPVLANIMRIRDPGNAPRANDRVPFVFVEPESGTEYGDWRLKYNIDLRIKNFIKKVNEEYSGKPVKSLEKAMEINKTLEKSVKFDKGPLKQYEKVEDPDFARENNLKIDTRYYINNQVRNPLTQFLSTIVGEERINDLFDSKTPDNDKTKLIREENEELTVVQLKQKAKDMNIKTSGTKAQLVLRIKEEKERLGGKCIDKKINSFLDVI